MVAGEDAGNVFVFKYDTNGALVWERQFRGSNINEAPRHVAIDDAGVTGGSADIYLARFDADGGLVWIRQDGTSLGEYPGGIALDPNGFLYLGGWTYGGLDGNVHWGDTSFSDAFIMKFSTAGVKQ